MVRKRVEESKLVAAQEDMAAIAKAEQIAYSYSGHYFRLQDLDRPETDQTIAKTSGSNPNPLWVQEAYKLPPLFWDGLVQPNQVDYLYETFKGPYLVMRKSEDVNDLMTNWPALFTDLDNAQTGGPILIDKQNMPYDDEKDWISSTDNNALSRRLHPVDPWGNPYVFFGASPPLSSMIDGSGNVDVALDHNYPPNTAAMNETTYVSFTTAIVYSMGPNGVPGAGGNPANSSDFYRGSSVLDPNNAAAPYIGQGDDLKFEF
jgi:hypothetical protein